LTTFLALYQGEQVDTAKLVAVSCSPDVVSRFASELLNDPRYAQDAHSDPVLNALTNGKRQALRLITKQEGQE
jgi:hypothetical protein